MSPQSKLVDRSLDGRSVLVIACVVQVDLLRRTHIQLELVSVLSPSVCLLLLRLLIVVVALTWLPRVTS